MTLIFKSLFVIKSSTPVESSFDHLKEYILRYETQRMSFHQFVAKQLQSILVATQNYSDILNYEIILD